MDETRKNIITHINRVRDLIRDFTDELKRRASEHDFSKLKNPEYELLKNSPAQYIHEYGTKEYADMLKRMEPILKIHHQNNTHHPEHYPNGIDGMDLYDICEMFFDWKASSEKYNNNGDIWKSIDVGRERFNMSDQLYNILKNTADRTWKDNQ